MAKLQEKYEAIIVLSTKLGEDGIKAVNEKVNELIAANGAIESVDEWGKRRLAYAINYETEGFYTLYNFTANPSFPAELDRVLKITDGVLRSLITTKPGK
ncbi:30S ribosomal protein S6 [Paludicola sp. MB14-C6]|uniref:30S ribosomal protein S6 n=1 Tax=Paludihabitans sp. MB14-C6 TaxID=3070656 RepID=UPI0027DCA1DE|nr:30S ribosomal protein S6 [Paludicola sp. MB14-C6]WMJ22793.1 30S ribosomal protein S6 [Paludicola sp. MB14-C6]